MYICTFIHANIYIAASWRLVVQVSPTMARLESTTLTNQTLSPLVVWWTTLGWATERSLAPEKFSPPHFENELLRLILAHGPAARDFVRQCLASWYQHYARNLCPGFAQLFVHDIGYVHEPRTDTPISSCEQLVIKFCESMTERSSNLDAAKRGWTQTRTFLFVFFHAGNSL